MKKFKNGEIVIGTTTLQVMYIGKYNEETECLDETYRLFVADQNRIEITYSCHGLVLVGKITPDIRKISIPCSEFMDIIELSWCSSDESLRQKYNEVNSGIIMSDLKIKSNLIH